MLPSEEVIGDVSQVVFSSGGTEACVSRLQKESETDSLNGGGEGGGPEEYLRTVWAQQGFLEVG